MNVIVVASLQSTMVEVIPALMQPDFDSLRREIERLSFAPSMQIDVMDGIFVPTLSWPFPDGDVMGDFRDLHAELEAHLMIEEAHRIGEMLARAGCTRILGHLESFPDTDEARRALVAWRAAGAAEVGFSLKYDTPLEEVAPLAEECSVLQVMGIRTIGVQGQPFEEGTVARIAELRERYPVLTIEVDGGVSKANILQVHEAGATRLVVGSAIVRAEHPQRAYEELLALVT